MADLLKWVKVSVHFLKVKKKLIKKLKKCELPQIPIHLKSKSELHI